MASDIIEALQNLKNDEQRAILMRFFKSGPGQYGEGDQFLGLKVPEVRTIAKMSRDLPLESVPELLVNSWHEVRLCGFLILTYKMERLYTRKMARNISAISQRDEIVRLYLEYADYANNWDLVDLSAPKIVGPWLLLPSEIEDKDAIMDSLAGSPILWRQRIAMVSTWKTTQQGNYEYALRYAIEQMPEDRRQYYMHMKSN